MRFRSPLTRSAAMTLCCFAVVATAARAPAAAQPAAPSPATDASSLADSDRPTNAAAEAHRLRGRRLFQTQSYLGAIEEYRRGYLIEPWPLFLYNIAQSWRLANEPCDAMQAYKQFLGEVAALPAHSPHLPAARAVADLALSQSREQGALCDRVAEVLAAAAAEAKSRQEDERPFFAAAAGGGGVQGVWTSFYDHDVPVMALQLTGGRFVDHSVMYGIRLHVTSSTFSATSTLDTVTVTRHGRASEIGASFEARIAMTSRLWASGALGLSILTRATEFDRYTETTGPSTSIGVGYALAVSGRAALDAMLAAQYSRYESTSLANAVLMISGRVSTGRW